jgi:hypothetical protein
VWLLTALDGVADTAGIAPRKQISTNVPHCSPELDERRAAAHATHLGKGRLRQANNRACYVRLQSLVLVIHRSSFLTFDDDLTMAPKMD